MDVEAKAARRVRFLDLVLFLFGLRLYSAEDILKWFNFGLRLACAAILYLNLIVFIVITDHKEDIFLSLCFIFKYMVLIALHHYFALKSRDLKHIFDEHERLTELFQNYETHKITSKGNCTAYSNRSGHITWRSFQEF